MFRDIKRVFVFTRLAPSPRPSPMRAREKKEYSFVVEDLDAQLLSAGFNE